MKPLISVQLYTLRDVTKSDMAGTLRQLAGIGYQGVETAGYGNLSADEFASAVRETGLGPACRKRRRGFPPAPPTVQSPAWDTNFVFR